MSTPDRHSDDYDPPGSDHPSRRDLDEWEREHAAAVERARVEAYREAHSAEAEVLADAWDEGYEAGDMDARAVNPAWPERTHNPYLPSVIPPAEGHTGGDA